MNSLEIKKIREKLNLTQKELAEVLNLHYRTVQKWESGETKIKGPSAFMLKDLLEKHKKGASISDLQSSEKNEVPYYDIDFLDGWNSDINNCISEKKELLERLKQSQEQLSESQKQVSKLIEQQEKLLSRS